MPDPTLTCALHPFPNHPAPPVALTAEVQLQHQVLQVTYRLQGALACLRMPQPREAAFVEGLWEHTCFEAFLGPWGEVAYVEGNAAPSGAWALFGFQAYREGMTRLDLAPKVRVDRQPNGLVLEWALDLASPVLAWMGPSLRLGLSAVLEAQDGTRSYWALKHPADRPDFHHPQAFALTLERTP